MPTMFHISRKSDWNVGDTLICGNDYNPFWLTCANYNPQTSLNGEQMSFFELFNRCDNLATTGKNVKYLYENLKNISKECAFYIREQVFEDIRKTYYHDKPSRQKCLWVCEYDQLSYWKTISNDKEKAVLTLNLDGTLFCGDDYWLTANTFSSIEYSERAHRYWSGEMSTSPHKEYLFYGTASITNVELIH